MNYEQLCRERAGCNSPPWNQITGTGSTKMLIQTANMHKIYQYQQNSKYLARHIICSFGHMSDAIWLAQCKIKAVTDGTIMNMCNWATH